MKKTAVSILTSICLITAPIPALAGTTNSFDLSVYETGMEHEDIKSIQRALKREGVYNHNDITSYYGSITKNAVMSFQKKYGLASDGVVGKSTIDKMEELGLFTLGNLSLNLYEEDMNHVDIKVLQRALKASGSYNNDFYTTYYGSDTKEAVKKFQKKYGLTVDGIAGQSTIKKMEKLNLVTHNLGGSIRTKSIVGNLSLSVYKKGTRHSDVKIIQKVLDRAGTFTGNTFTTYFGNTTEESVKKFQNKYGLSSDGVVGKSTIEKMKALGYITHTVSRGMVSLRKGYGEYLEWWTQIKDKLIKPNDILEVKDLATGKTFKLKAVAGSNHMDVETLTAEDTKIMKSIWGGFTWERRAVIVYTKGRAIAASLNGMPHAGRDDKPYGKNVSNRSKGYGYGYNLDKVKGNGMSGVICLHFKGSKLHKNGQVDHKHQYQVKKAAGRVK